MAGLLIDDGAPAAGTISIDRLIGCVTRELRMRRQVYPNLVRTGRMTAPAAAREIREMEGVLERLQDLTERPNPAQLDLLAAFSEGARA